MAACVGYDAVIGDITMKLEHFACMQDKLFVEVMQDIENTNQYERILHVSKKYEKTIPECISRIWEYHNSWED